MTTPNNIVVGNQSKPQGQFGSMVTLPYIVANIQNECNRRVKGNEIVPRGKLTSRVL